MKTCPFQISTMLNILLQIMTFKLIQPEFHWINPDDGNSNRSHGESSRFVSRECVVFCVVVDCWSNDGRF